MNLRESTDRRVIAPALVLALALVAAVLAAGPSAAAPNLSGGSPTVVSARLAAPAGGAKAFWTAKRMRRAEPLPAISLPEPDGATSLAEPSQDAQPSYVPQSAPSSDSPTRSRSGAVSTRAAGPTANGIDTGDSTVFPNSANGLLFGLVTIDGEDEEYQCSASVINSDAGDTLLTAGHCVIDPDTGAVAKYLLFVPGARDDSEPFGKWGVSAYRMIGSGQDQGVDIALLTVPNRVSDNASIEDVVGGLGIGFNLARKQTYKQYGYPGETPYDGTRLYRNNSKLVLNDASFAPATLGINSDFTPGSSGGPWIVGSNHRVLSVSSYHYESLPGVMFGPYFGSAAEHLYDAANGSSNFKFVSVKRRPGHGTARLVLSLPAPGQLGLWGKGVHDVYTSFGKAGKHAVTVKPSGKIRARLHKRGWVYVRVTVAFKPVGGHTRTRHRKLLLVFK